MSSAQFYALEQTDASGQLRSTDRRTLRALARRGWIRAEHTRKGKRKKTIWLITEAGRAAFTNSPQVIAPRTRPPWPAYWDVQRQTPSHYIAEGHEITRPSRTMLWRVVCPAQDPQKPVNHCDTLTEAVEHLVQHSLYACRISSTPTAAVDLDQLQASHATGRSQTAADHAEHPS